MHKKLKTMKFVIRYVFHKLPFTGSRSFSFAMMYTAKSDYDLASKAFIIEKKN